jgi:hypothetical protein
VRVTGTTGRLGRAVPAYPRRNPVTAGYLVVLAVGWVVLAAVPAAVRGRVLAAVSTNLANLPRRPVLALLGSPLVVDTSAGPLFAALVVVGGIAVCLAALERRIGGLRAALAGLAGHLVATALSLAVVVLAVRHGWYPASVRSAPDYGVSYLAMTAATAVAPLLRRWPLVAGYLLVVLALPLAMTTWYGWLPDFTTIGHLTAGLCGLVVAVLVRRGAGRCGMLGR